eukprot:762749-Hanusia_phi.AAC.7
MLLNREVQLELIVQELAATTLKLRWQEDPFRSSLENRSFSFDAVAQLHFKLPSDLTPAPAPAPAPPQAPAPASAALAASSSGPICPYRLLVGDGTRAPYLHCL